MDEQGSILLGALFLAVVIGLTLGSLMYQIDQTRQNSVRVAVRHNAESSQSVLQMILSKATTCNANLTAGAFGSTVAELRTRSTQRLTRIVVPGPVLANPPVTLAPDSRFGRVQIKQIYFTDPIRQFAPDNAYLADLTLEVSAFGENIIRHIVIPFYFDTDSAGRLIGCLATFRPGSLEGSGLTLEGELCAQWLNAGYHYRHAGRYCHDTSVP